MVMESDIISDLLRKATDGHETVFDIAVDNGVTRVEINRRLLLPERRVIEEDLPIARDPARAHTFHEIGAFAKYCETHAGESAVGLANSESQRITVVLDELVDAGRELITFEAKLHPMFLPWYEMLDEATDVIDFSVFAQKYRRSIRKPDGKELAMIFSQIKLSKSVEIQRGVGRKSLNGVMVHTEIAGVKQDTMVDLPDSIEIECPVFIGTKPIRMVFDVLVTDVHDNVVVYLTSPDLEAMKFEAFEQFVQILREDAPSILVGLGQVASTPWRTIDQR